MAAAATRTSGAAGVVRRGNHAEPSGEKAPGVRPAMMPRGTAKTSVTTARVAACQATARATLGPGESDRLQDGEVAPAAADGAGQQVGHRQQGHHGQQRAEDDGKVLDPPEVHQVGRRRRRTG